MNKQFLRFVVLLVVFIYSFSHVNAAPPFKYKETKDFKTLEKFKSIEAFEKYYGDYVQDCLDNTGGGSGGIPCENIAYELWDRELNIFYKKLSAVLDDKTREALKTSQKAWLQARDSAIACNSLLLDKHYDTDGTMYLLMRSGDADRIITPMIKQRALFLKDEFDLASEKPESQNN